jgi:hypothetical protein
MLSLVSREITPIKRRITASLEKKLDDGKCGDGEDYKKVAKMGNT